MSAKKFVWVFAISVMLYIIVTGVVNYRTNPIDAFVHENDSYNIIKQPVNIQELDVLVLMMHHLSDEPKNDYTISGHKFDTLLTTLERNGYETITTDDLINYVYQYEPLPEKSVVLTFDDGYLSNYEIAYPILKKHNAHAIIFIIGSSVGKNTYKDTDVPIIPHFNRKQAKEMISSGLVEIGSHSYDLHQSVLLEDKSSVARENMLPVESDSEESFIQLIRNDVKTFNQYYKEAALKPVHALAYPHGAYSNELTQLLVEEGIDITFTTEEGMNKVVHGLPQTLLNLKRYNVYENMDVQSFLSQ